jgi:hypothetical protein
VAGTRQAERGRQQHRLREDGLTHPAATSIANLTRGGFQTLSDVVAATTQVPPGARGSGSCVNCRHSASR